jgi:hypothetical protein
MHREPTVREVAFTCGPNAHLRAVAKHKIGSAVVVDPDTPNEVVGLFTTTDALCALAIFAPYEA